MSQGVEQPLENSTTTNSTCGQAITMPLFMTYSTTAAPSPAPPPGNDGGYVYSMGGHNFTDIWTYRRAWSAQGLPFMQVNDDDTSQQNWSGGNDYTAGYIFVPI